MCGIATLVMDASTKSRNATAQSRIRIRLPRHVASVKDAEPAVIAVPPGCSEEPLRWHIQRWQTQHTCWLAGLTTVKFDFMPEHVPLVDRVPERLRERPTWLISRAYARASGLLQEGFAQDGDGLRGYH